MTNFVGFFFLSDLISYSLSNILLNYYLSIFPLVAGLCLILLYGSKIKGLGNDMKNIFWAGFWFNVKAERGGVKVSMQLKRNFSTCTYLFTTYPSFVLCSIYNVSITVTWKSY